MQKYNQQQFNQAVRKLQVERKTIDETGGLFLDAIYDFGRRGKMEPPGDSVTEWHCLHYTICVHTYLIFKKIKKFETIF